MTDGAPPAGPAGHQFPPELVAEGHPLHYRTQTPAISPDGRFVAFASIAADPESGEATGTFDVLLLDRQLGTTEPVSVSPAGRPGNADSFGPSVSEDGRFVAFTSEASNLVDDKTPAVFNVFVRDRERGSTELVSASGEGAGGDDSSFRASISSDGRFVTFTSAASNLTSGAASGVWNIYVRDREQGRTEVASVSADGAPANRPSAGSALSADGRYVVFHSAASNLLPQPCALGGVFLRDREQKVTELVSVDRDGAPAGDRSGGWAISADGRFVAFASQAPNLTADGTDGTWQVFVRDREQGRTELASAGPDGAPARGAVHFLPLLSADGRFVAFASQAPNLTADGTDGTWQVFVRDREQGRTELASAGPDGAPGNSDSVTDCVGLGIGAHGRHVAFTSAASNLATGAGPGSVSAFVRDREQSRTEAARGRRAIAATVPDADAAGSRDDAAGLVADLAHGQVLAAPGTSGKAATLARARRRPGPAADSRAAGRGLNNDRRLSPQGVATIAPGGHGDQIIACGEASLDVPFFSRSTARFTQSRSCAAWLGDGPVNADKITHTDQWSVDAHPHATVVGDAPPGSASDGAGGLIWQTEVEANWLSVHSWSELEFRTPGRLFRSTYSVTGAFQFGSAFYVVSGDASAAT